MTITLHPYQEQIVRQICAEQEDVLLDLPTGSGKTLIILVATRLLHSSSLTHVLIAAPQRQIEAGFIDHDVTHVKCGDKPIAIEPEFCRALKGRSRSKSVTDYCISKSPQHAAVLTHQALAKVPLDKLPADLSAHLLVVDEAHHAPADRLRDFIRVWRERGGRLIFATATPYRSDWQPVRLNGMHLIRRSLAEHMEDEDGAFAPRYIDSEIVGLDASGEVTAAMFNGEEAPPESVQDVLAKQMVEKWESEGRPKTIVKVPTLRGGTRKLVTEIRKSFEKRGAKVLDGTGQGKDRQRYFIEALQRDRTAPYGEAHDVVIGIERVKEGTDWPVCSHVFIVGMPKSLQLVIQLLGRAMRKKPGNYPIAYRDTAKMIFFVPVDGGRVLDNLGLQHSRCALYLTTFLADTQTGQQWSLDREIQGAITEGLSDTPSGKQKAIVDQVNGTDPISHPVRALVTLVAADIVESNRGNEPLPLHKMMTTIREHPLISQIPPTESEEAIRRVLAEVLLTEEGTGLKFRNAVRKEMRNEVRRRAGHFPDGVQRMSDDVLRDVLEQFRNETLEKCAPLEHLSVQLHRLTGGKMRQFAQRLQEAVSQPLTIAEIREEIWRHYTDNGKWPSAVDTYIERFGCTWGVLNANLVAGYRGLPGGSSLSNEVAETKQMHGIEVVPQMDLTLNRIIESIEAFYRDRDCFPCLTTLEMVPGLGITWRSVDIYLRTGQRGLPGGSSLPVEVEKTRKRLGVAPPIVQLSLDEIHTGIRAYQQRTGHWPTVTSGLIEELRIKANTLNTRLAEGKVGLSGNSSLAQEVRNVQDSLGVPRSVSGDLSIADVRGAIQMWFAKNGTWPRADSGMSALGITFRTLNKYLKQGGRGLPGRSSLVKEVQAIRGDRPSDGSRDNQ